MHKYPSINEIFTIQSIDNVGKRYVPGMFTDATVSMLKDIDWWWSEKINGLNIRVGWDGEHNVEFAGRNNKDGNLPGDETGAPDLLADTFTVAEMRKLYRGKPMQLYVEAFGAKLAKNGDWYGDRPYLALLDVRIGDVWLERDNVADVADRLGVITPPTIGHGSLASAVSLVETGLVSRFGQFPAEGIVAVPDGGLLNRKGERIITKIKTDFFHGDKLAKRAFTAPVANSRTRRLRL